MNLSSDDSDEITMQLVAARRATNEEVQDKRPSRECRRRHGRSICSVLCRDQSEERT